MIGQNDQPATRAGYRLKSRLLAALCLAIAAFGSCAGQTASVDANIVEIITPNTRATGFAVNDDGDVVTALHVVDKFVDHPDQITVVETRPTAGRELAVDEILWQSHELDLVVIHVDGLAQPPVTLATAGLQTGDAVYAVGFTGQPSGLLEPTVRDGSVAGISSGRAGGAAPGEPPISLVQHDAPFQRGDGGAPLVNACGWVVGINRGDNAQVPDRKSRNNAGPAASVRQASYAIDVASLRARLDDAGIAYMPAATACRAASGGSGALLIVGAAVAVVVVFFRSGRRTELAPHSNRGRHWTLSGTVQDGRRISIAVRKSDLTQAKDGLTIGRDPRRCQIVIDDPTVSGRHARLSLDAASGPDAGHVWVEDLHSTNGTFVDGQPVPPGPDKAVPLPIGSALVLGGCRVRFRPA